MKKVHSIASVCRLLVQSAAMLMVFAASVYGQGTVRWIGGTSTDWGTASNWTIIGGSPSTPPGSADAVQIGFGAITNQPTLNSATTIASLTYGNAAASTLTINDDLTITGAITNTITTTARVHNINLSSGKTLSAASANLSPAVASANMTITFNGGMFLLSGNFTAQPTAATTTITLAVGTGVFSVGGTTLQGAAANQQRNCDITVSTGALTFTGPYTKNGAGSDLTSSGAATIVFGNTVTNTLGTSFNLTGSTTTLNGSGAITPTVAMTYGNVVVANSAAPTFGTGTVTISGGLTVNGTLSIAGTTSSVTGATDVNGRLNITNATGSKTFTNVTINANDTLNFSAAETATITGDLTMGNSSIISGSVTGIITTTGNLNIPGTGVKIGNATITVNDTTLITGDVDFNSATGTKTFAGPVVLSGSGGWSSSANSAFTFQRGITHNGSSFSSGTGVYTFNTNAQSLAGSSQLTIANLTATTIAVTNNNTNINGLTVTTALAGTGGITNPVNGLLNIQGTSLITTLTATAVPNTVVYNGAAAQTIKGTTYNSLTINGDNSIKTLGGATTVNNVLSVDAGTLNFGTQNLSMGASADLNIADSVSITSTTGTRNLNNITVSVSGTWSSTVAEAFGITGSISNSGTFTAGTGVYTMSGTGKSISGTISIPSLTVSGTVTNNDSLTVATALAGVGTLTNNTNAKLVVGNTITLTTLTASASGNTVYYNWTNTQTIKATTYNNLYLTGTSAKTAGGGLTVNGDFTLDGSASFAAGTSLTHSFAGNWIVNTSAVTPFTFTTASTINFNTPGSLAATSLDGTTSATIAFNDININNTGGFNLKKNISFSTGTTPTLTIGANATLTPDPAVTLTSTGTLTGTGTAQVTRTTATADFFTQYNVTTRTLTNLTVAYVGSGAQSVNAATYGSIVVDNSSGVTSAGGVTVNGNLSILSGTWNDNGNQITGNGSGTMTLATGTSLILGSAGTGTSFPTLFTSIALDAASTIEYSSNQAQTIKGTNYGNLTSSGSGARTLENGGTIGIAGTFTPGSNSYTITNSTIDFNGGGSQTVPAFSYNNLSLSNAGTKTFAAGTEGIAGTFSITGASADLTSNNSTIDYNGSGSQSVLAVNYNGLTLSNAGTKTFSAGTTGIAGDFSVSGATADAVTNTTTINFDGPGSQIVAAINYYALAFSNAGTKTLAAGTTGVANAFTVTGSAAADATTNSTTVQYSGATLQTSPVMTYYDLAINKTGSRAVLNNVVVNNNLNILLGQARVTNQDITVLGTTTIDGTFVVAQIAGTKILGNVVVNTGGSINFTANSDLTINGNLQVDGTGSITSGTGLWSFQKPGGGGTLSGTAAAPAISNASFTTSYTHTGSFVFGDLAVSGTTLTNNGTLTVNTSLTGSGTLTQGSGATLTLLFAGPPAISTFNANAVGNIVQYSLAGAQTIFATDYDNLTLATSGVKTFPSGTTRIAGALTFGGTAAGDATTNGSTIGYNGSGAQNIAVLDYTNLTLSTSGVKSFGSGTTRIAGALSITGTATADAVTNTATVEYNGSSIQTSPGITYYNLTINNAGGVSLGGTTTVNNTLTLSNGVVSTGANTLQIGASGSVSRTSGHVVGNLGKDVPTGSPSITFEVGDAGNYTPVTTAFTNVTSGGALTVSSTSGDHPQVLTSGIEASLSVNRYWTLSGTLTYTSYDITMNFQPGDVDGGANTASFIIGRYNSGWTLPTVGTLTSTSSQATGVTAFGDFQIGEVSIYSLKTWDGGASTSNWGDANNWNPNGVPSSSNNVDLTGAVTININTAASVNSITLNNASLVVTILSGNSLTAAGDLSLAGGTLNTAASFPAVTGTVNISGGTVGYTNTGAQTISAQAYNNLALSGSGVKTFSSGTTSLTGDLTFAGTATADATTNSTTVDYNGGSSQSVGALDYYNLTFSNAGTKTFASGTSRIAGTFTIGGTASADAATNSTTIEYNGSGAQTVNAINYHHLTLAVSGTKTFASGTTGIAGDLTLTGSAAADATTNSTTITYNGSGSQNVAAINYNNLTLAVSGTKTFAAGTTNIAGDLTLTGSAAADATTNSTTITYDGSGAQNVAAINYNNLTLAVSGTKTFAAGTTGIASALSLTGTATADIVANSTTLDFNGSAQSVPALDYFNLTLSNIGTKTLASGTTTLKSNLTITGTAVLDATTNSTTVEFYGTTTQTSSPATFYDLIINKVSNRLVVNDLTVNNNFTITTGEGRLTAGAFTVLGTTTVTQLLTVSNASATPVFGDIVVNSTGTINFSAAATAAVNGNLQVDGSGTLTSGTGLWTFQKPGGGTIGGTASSISITNAAFTTDYAVNSDMTIGGLTVTGATLTNNAAMTLNASFGGTGAFTQSSGSTLSIAFNGSSTIAALNASVANNLVQYNSAGAQDIVAANYDNLTLANAGTKAFGSGSTGIAGTLSITGSAAGDAATNSSTIDYNGSGAQTITLLTYYHLSASNAGIKSIPSGTLQLAGNFQVTGSAVIDAVTNSTTVEFMGSSSQAIPAVNYYNLTSSSSGARVLASSGSIGIAAAFTVGANAYTITGSTIDFNGAGSQTIPIFNFNNITFSGDRSGGVITLATGTITVAGNGTSTASNLTYTTTGDTVDYNGTAAQTVAGITYGSLTFSSTGAKTLSESAIVNNDMIVNSMADVTVDATGILTVNGNLINDGILTNDGSITLP